MKKTNKTLTIEDAVEISVKVDKVDIVEVKLSEAQLIDYARCISLSDRIRYLHSQNFSRSSIATYLNIRYQHVRNVLITPLKRKVLEFKFDNVEG
jgi:hypothetical protein